MPRVGDVQGLLPSGVWSAVGPVTDHQAFKGLRSKHTFMGQECMDPMFIAQTWWPGLELC